MTVEEALGGPETKMTHGEMFDIIVTCLGDRTEDYLLMLHLCRLMILSLKKNTDFHIYFLKLC